MEKQKQKVAPSTQGVEGKEFSQKEVFEFVQRDLRACLQFLQAIYSDPDCMDSVAKFIHGRHVNAIEALKRKADGDSINKQ
jgi:hypothetical protein